MARARTLSASAASSDAPTNCRRTWSCFAGRPVKRAQPLVGGLEVGDALEQQVFGRNRGRPHRASSPTPTLITAFVR